MGVLDQFGVKMIGATAEAIDKAEDRELFREAMHKIGLETPKSSLANASDLKKADRAQHAAEVARIKAQKLGPDAERRALETFEGAWAAGEADRKRRYVEKGLIEALEALADIGLPAIIRPSFTLAGTGGGVAFNKAEFLEIIERGLDASPTTEVLIEESVLGWKEFEMEVVRDKRDNCIIICLIEALEALADIGLPAIIRPSFTLAGTGGGVAFNKAEFLEIIERGLDASPTTEVLIEESVLGWKEFEMEVVRDKRDNCIIICSI